MRALSLLCLFLLACPDPLEIPEPGAGQGGPPPAAPGAPGGPPHDGPISQNPPVVQSGGGGAHSTPAVGAGFGETKFPCCSQPQLTEALSAYASLSAGLAADDPIIATRWVEALATALEALTAEGVAADEVRAAATTALPIVDSMKSVPLQDIRAGFGKLWAPMKIVAQGAKTEALAPEGGLELVVAFCPMAPAPGRWIQSETQLANPYYGSQMLRCGVFEPL